MIPLPISEPACLIPSCLTPPTHYTAVGRYYLFACLPHSEQWAEKQAQHDRACAAIRTPKIVSGINIDELEIDL